MDRKAFDYSGTLEPYESKERSTAAGWPAARHITLENAVFTLTVGSQRYRTGQGKGYSETGSNSS